MKNQDHKMQDLGQIQPAQKPETLRDMEETKKIERKRKVIIGFLSLGLVLFLAGAAYGGYLLGTKKKDQPQVLSEAKPEEEKAIYRNTRFGYQFEYHKSWQVDGEDNSKKISIVPPDRPEDDKREIKISALANDGSSSSSFIEENIDANDYKDGSLESISYATKGSMIEGYNDAYKTAYFASDKFAIEISVICSAEDEDTYSSFEQILKSFEFSQVEGAPEKTYTIQPGDTLFTISLKFGVDMDTLAQYNGLEDPNSIKYGMVIKIPSASDEATEKKFNINLDQMKKLQEDADAGRASSRLDPVAVAKEEAQGVFGINSSFDFTLVSIDKGRGEAQVRASSGDKKYLIYLTQPVKIGEGGVWTTQSIKKEA